MPATSEESTNLDLRSWSGVDLVDDEAALRSRRWVGAVRGDGDEHALTCLAFAACDEGGADGEHAGEFAMGARLRRHRDGGHIGELHQPVGQFLDHFERALDG